MRMYVKIFFKKMLNLLYIFMEGFFLRWGIIKVCIFLEGLEARFFFAGNISDLKEKKRKKKEKVKQDGLLYEKENDK